MITSYNEMRRENKTLREENGGFRKEVEDLREKVEGFRKENEYLREENGTLKRHPIYYDNSNTPPSQKVLKHSRKVNKGVQKVDSGKTPPKLHGG